MKKNFITLLALLALLAGCRQAAPQPPTAAPTALPTATALPPTFTPSPTLTPTPTKIPATETPAPTPTPSYPVEGRGPTGFAPGINPLTGLELKDPALLERRPIVIKVENLPRLHRPQWGLSLADHVFEYYTEQGATRFAAVFYGSNADRVGPIRSGRFFDSNIVEMYKGVFVYGSAYPPVQQRFFNSSFANRLVLETTISCPALCRVDPNGQNLLVANTLEMGAHLATKGIENARQNLDGLFFKMQPPDAGEPANQVFVRFSGAIYNRWDYDATAGRYLRYVDMENDLNRDNEVYGALTDRLNEQPITAQNVVTLCVAHQYFVKRDDTEVMEILLNNNAPAVVSCDGQSYTAGSGPAYVARDGKIYQATWTRAERDSLPTLRDAQGNPFPLKPGQTWFEVIGASSDVTQNPDGSWRFTHGMVP